MAPRPPRTSISVCSGAGMLDNGVERGVRATLSDIHGEGWPILLGVRALEHVVEPVVYIERDAFAASVLVARMEEQALAPAPLWDDVCTFDARPWRGLVDLVAGGTPCQDLSVAGKRAGLDGERSRLFFEHVRIAVECEAPFFFWENVAGATRVVPRVCEYLEERGYRGAWAVVRASDVGAPHQRARVFLLAHSPRFGRGEQDHEERAEPWPRARGNVGWGCMRLGAPPPNRDSIEDWTRLLAVRPDLAPALPQPRLRRVADGLEGWMDADPRSDRLRLTGNGVVPEQAAHAFRGLWRALFGEE